MVLQLVLGGGSSHQLFGWTLSPSVASPSTTRSQFSCRCLSCMPSLLTVKQEVSPLGVRRGRDGFFFRRRSFQLHVTASNEAGEGNLKPKVLPPRSVSVILLAGGTGKRMGANMPKQYLPLLGQSIALYSFYTFSSIQEVSEIIVVCDPSYKDIFEEAGKGRLDVTVKFALPGKERQDSVLSGLKEIQGDAKLASVHDSARPLVTVQDIHKVFADAWIHGAAVLGVPVKATIKEAGADRFVLHTLDRRRLWEIQTPQVIKPSLLQQGFELVQQHNLEVTDDVSVVEHLNHPVFITEGSYTNLKVTTPDDMLIAERIILQSREQNVRS